MVCIRREVSDSESDASPEQVHTRSYAVEVLAPRRSPNSINSGGHVVIVMDALRYFSYELLQWALEYVIPSGYAVTLLGVMPWIPLALSCKVWLDVWTFDLGDLSSLKGGRNEWKNDSKYQKLLGILQLCEEKGVVPHMKVAMGHPLRLVVLEQTTGLHASLVVIDRHLRKNKQFFAERLQSNVVMMSNDGGVDMLKIQSEIDQIDTTPGQSPGTLPPTPQVIYSEELSELLRSRTHECNN